jgi:hypothetical protein
MDTPALMDSKYFGGDKNNISLSDISHVLIEDIEDIILWWKKWASFDRKEMHQ